MNNRNLLIGAGVLVVGYLLWKKSVKSKKMKCEEEYSLQRKQFDTLEYSLSLEEKMNKKRQWMKMNCK
jgi:hypothetical protein